MIRIIHIMELNGRAWRTGVTRRFASGDPPPESANGQVIMGAGGADGFPAFTDNAGLSFAIRAAALAAQSAAPMCARVGSVGGIARKARESRDRDGRLEALAVAAGA